MPKESRPRAEQTTTPATPDAKAAAEPEPSKEEAKGEVAPAAEATKAPENAKAPPPERELPKSGADWDGTGPGPVHGPENDPALTSPVTTEKEDEERHKAREAKALEEEATKGAARDERIALAVPVVTAALRHDYTDPALLAARVDEFVTAFVNTMPEGTSREQFTVAAGYFAGRLHPSGWPEATAKEAWAAVAEEKK